MAATLLPAGAATGSVDLAHAGRALSSIGRVLDRLSGVLAPAGDVFGIVGSFRGGFSDILGGISKIGGDGVGGTLGRGGGAGLGLACHALDSSGRVLVHVGDGRPIMSASNNCLY